MEMKDILTLANAGFTAQQIGALVKVSSQPQQQQPQQQQPQQQQLQQQQQQPQGDFNTQLMAELAKINNTMQANAITQSQQPQQETTEDVLAKIINPPKKEVI